MSAELRIVQESSGGASARRDIAATRAELDRFGRSTTAAGTASGRSSSRVSRLGSSVGLLARSFGPLAAAVGAGAILKFGADSIRAASDTQQAMGAIDAVFGKSSRVVKQWATDAADSVGLAKSEYGDLAVVLGSMLKNQGIEGFAGKTRELIKLGSDLAAQFGGSTKDAVEAIGSLMRGETDPIERYGVSIKQSGVNAVLAARGQEKLRGKARQTADAQARLKLLTDQTTSAQGAFRRESGTLAGAQQRLSAKITNLKSNLGAKLIPVVSKVVDWLQRTLGQSDKTGGRLRALARVVQSYVRPILRGFKGALDDVSEAFKRSKKNGDGFTKTVRALGKVVQKVAPLVGGYFGFQIRLVGKAIQFSIGWFNTMYNVVSRIGSIARSVAGDIGNLQAKLNNLTPGKVLGKLGGAVGGIFNSAPGVPVMGGLRRDVRGYGAGGSSVTLAPSFAVAPTIHVTIGRRELRDVVVQVVQGVIREQQRREGAYA